MSFFDNSEEFKVLILDNILTMKMLHDRGLKVYGAEAPAEYDLSNFLMSLFPGNYKFEDMEQNHPSLVEARELFETLKEDTDEYYWVGSYLEREHYWLKVKVDIPDNELIQKKIMKKLEEFNYKKDLDTGDYFPDFVLFESVEWWQENNEIIGFKFHFVEIDENYPWWDYPMSFGFYYRDLIAVWDILQAYRRVQDAKNNTRNRHRSRVYTSKNTKWTRRKKYGDRPPRSV